MSPVDIETFKALQMMKLSHDYDSIMTEQLLECLRERYNIPADYELHAPWPKHRSYDPLPNGFKLTIDALEVGLRFLLHSIIEAYLEWWRISPS